MRAAAILGLGCSPQDLKPFQTAANQTETYRTDAKLTEKIEWNIVMPGRVMPGGMPAASDEADVILLFGGDGTIHRHLGQLVELGLPVLVVPAGSGNDFACALGLKRVRDSLAAWRKFCSGTENIRKIDLGVIVPLDTGELEEPELAARLGEQYFGCVAGVGLDGEVSRRANQLPRWLRGHGGYALTLLPTIFKFAPLPMKISTSDIAENQTSADQNRANDWIIRSDQPTLLAAFANTPHYGGGMKIAPQAEMDDGLLDVCIIGGMDPFKLFCMFPTVYSGRHLSIREVSYFQSPRTRIETEHPLDVYADGEYVCQTPVAVGVAKGALKVVAP